MTGRKYSSIGNNANNQSVDVRNGVNLLRMFLFKSDKCSKDNTDI
jgi:hypothetical protein